MTLKEAKQTVQPVSKIKKINFHFAPKHAASVRPKPKVDSANYNIIPAGGKCTLHKCLARIGWDIFQSIRTNIFEELARYKLNS